MARAENIKPQKLSSTSKHLLPIWAVRAVESLTKCTVQLKLYIP